MAAAAPKLERPNVVLVHGGFADGSGWEGVYTILKGAGCTVAVSNPTISLEDDVAVTKRTIAAQDGPVVLVGHSYGGAVVTEAGSDPNVAGLVYIAAFAPDAGESVNKLIADSAAGGARAADPPAPGRLPVPRPGEVPRLLRRRRGGRARGLHGRLPGALGRRRPCRRGQRAGLEFPAKLVPGPTADRMIPPDAQRFMSKRAGATVVEAEGSHAIYVSKPAPVAELHPDRRRRARSAS